MNSGVIGLAATACASMPAMFTDHYDEGDVQQTLLRVCMACPALGECTDYVLSVDVEGYAAAMTPADRKRINAIRQAVA